MTESKEEKALRYLDEGRIEIVRAVPAPGIVVARAHGSDGATYDLGFDPDKRQWRCTCPARTSRCSHLIAITLVAGHGRPAIVDRA